MSSAATIPADLSVLDSYAQIHALLDHLADAPLSGCSETEILTAAEEHERATRRMAAVGHRQIVELSDREIPKRLGYRSLPNFLSHHLRITEPVRRIRQMEKLAKFHSATGELLPPRCPTLAAAAADGLIGPGHVHAVLEIFDKIPTAIAHDVKLAAEATLGELACDHTPAEITTLGMRLLAHLDPDGELTEAKDRARQRNLWINRQNVQKMSKLTGHLDPVTRAMLDTLLSSWAAPGMNIPDDPHSPTGAASDADPEALSDAASRDDRSQSQRNHDALHALLKAVLDGGLLGNSHRGMPPHLIIKVTEKDLREQTGTGTTATGTVLPITDVIALAAHAQPWLAVFADHTAVPLYLGRGHRLASTGQRLALFSMDGGHRCSAPGCDQPATHNEIHHAALDFAQGGRTDITTLTGTCPVHNRMVGPKPGQYTTTIATHGHHRGRVIWTRNPDNLPTTPGRVNTIPDIETLFRHRLHNIRNQIHERPPYTGAPVRPPLSQWHKGSRDRQPVEPT